MEVAFVKGIGIISTAALVLLLGIAAPGYAEQEKQGEKQAKPEAQQHAQQSKQAKPEAQQHAQQSKQAKPEAQQHAQQPKQAKPEAQQRAQQPKQAKPEQQKQQHAQQQKQAKPQPQQHAQQQKQAKSEQQKQKQQHAQQQKQQQQPAGARGRGRIPEDRYRANFGREHTFRVSQADYRGHRFHYGGYWFGFVDPWPSNWLYTQNVYVVDMNGVYYLCNPMYPGVNIALSFTL
jgi:glucan-binding YG repeat protein